MAGMGAYLSSQAMTKNTSGTKRDFSAANDRRKLLYDKPSQREAREKLGNWGWYSDYGPRPPTTAPIFRKTVPQGAGDVDWKKEENQWLRSPEFRKMHVANYRNAHSTERDIALRNQLVAGYWHETITKGRVLHARKTADGQYNPDGLNLNLYCSK